MSGFDWDKDYSIEELLQSVIAIKEFPNHLAKVITPLKEEDFEKTYREGGWNIRQIIHHLSDSHLNGYTRTKHTIFQDVESHQGYNQDQWNSFKDSNFHHEASFMILLGIHQRWSLLLLECLKEPEIHLAKTLIHSDGERKVSLAQLIALYAWHGAHHLEQIQTALKN